METSRTVDEGSLRHSAQEVSYWVYYESLFYISAMMHLPLAQDVSVGLGARRLPDWGCG